MTSTKKSFVVFSDMDSVSASQPARKLGLRPLGPANSNILAPKPLSAKDLKATIAPSMTGKTAIAKRTPLGSIAPKQFSKSPVAAPLKPSRPLSASNSPKPPLAYATAKAAPRKSITNPPIRSDSPEPPPSQSCSCVHPDHPTRCPCSRHIWDKENRCPVTGLFLNDPKPKMETSEKPKKAGEEGQARALDAEPLQDLSAAFEVEQVVERTEARAKISTSRIMTPLVRRISPRLSSEGSENASTTSVMRGKAVEKVKTSLSPCKRTASPFCSQPPKRTRPAKLDFGAPVKSRPVAVPIKNVVKAVPKEVMRTTAPRIVRKLR
ncbi:hypothetical protein HDU93_005582 [Gonapodya sp. JEL0774]|nr:hypothetical protein HDU93_005582 [Gonapodya sp. JEL0774]